MTATYSYKNNGNARRKCTRFGHSSAFKVTTNTATATSSANSFQKDGMHGVDDGLEIKSLEETNMRQKLVHRNPKSFLKRFLYLVLTIMILVPNRTSAWSLFSRSVDNDLSPASSPSTPDLLQQIYFRNATRLKDHPQHGYGHGNLDIEPKSALNTTSNSVRVNDRNSLDKDSDISSEQPENSKNKGHNPNGNHAGGVNHHGHQQHPKNKTNCPEDEKDYGPHGVEDILRQIFGAADDFDEEDDEFEEDEFEHSSQSQHDDHFAKDYELSNGTTVEHKSRRFARSAAPDPRRGPLELEDEEERDTHNEDDTSLHHHGNARKQPVRKRQPPKKKGVHNQGGSNSSGVDKKADNLAKYNAYMEAVFSRMNSLIKKKRMDPLRVNLYAGPSKGAGAGGHKNSKHSNNKKKNSRMDDDDDDEDESVSRSSHDEQFDDDDGSTEEHEDEDDGSSDEERKLHGPSVHNVHLGNDDVFGRSIRSLLANISQFSDAVMSKPKPEVERFNSESVEGGSGDEVEGRGNDDENPRGPPKQKNGGGGGKGPKQNGAKRAKQNNQQGKNSTRPGGNNKKKNQKNKNGPRPTRGILHGLSTLRRDGNVQVVKEGVKARLIRSKFLLGPVALEILPKKGKQKGTSRENTDNNNSPSTSDSGSSHASASPAATATAPQLKGILEVRLSPNRPTRIRRLRVFPPGNVQVNEAQSSLRGSGYRKITPQATARLRQTAIQVVRQVDHKLRPKPQKGNKKKKGQKEDSLLV